MQNFNTSFQLHHHT
ncbi:Protein of unknown function [Bacillus wiedmannii]|nr:Protein of unknown function [Bacillus wiedmannii]